MAGRREHETSSNSDDTGTRVTSPISIACLILVLAQFFLAGSLWERMNALEDRMNRSPEAQLDMRLDRILKRLESRTSNTAAQ